MNKDRWKHLARKVLYWRPVRNILHFSRCLVLPGFQGVPIFDVIAFFIKGLTKGALNQRSAAISFHFFLSLFPLILFIATLLPYLHMEFLMENFMETIAEVAPNSVGDYVNSTITDLMQRKHKGLMTIGFLSSIFVSSSGVNALLLSLNNPHYTGKKRSMPKRRLISVLIVWGLSLGVAISMMLIIFAKQYILYLLANKIIKNFVQFYFLRVLKWLIIVAIIYLVFALVYYITPVDKTGYRFFSAGASLGTVLFILFSQGFNWYIIHFSQYNVVYGVIGVMIIFLIWIYLNSYIMLIGYELNVAIANAYSQGYAVSKQDKTKVNSLGIAHFIRKIYPIVRGRKTREVREGRNEKLSKKNDRI